MKQKTPPAEPTSAETGDAEAVDRLFTFRFEAVFDKSVAKLPAGDRQVIGALRRFFAYRHNGFLLVEALDICTRHNVNPPVWVLVAINEGFQRFNDGNISLERALHMGKSHRQEYNQYREQQPLMAELHTIINRDPERNISDACLKLAMRKKPALNEHTLQKQYRRMWLGFYDYVKGK